MKLLPISAALCLLLLVGCSTRIEEQPREIVEDAAAVSIVESGGDPDEWRIEGSCVAQGPCRVDVYASGSDEPLASNRYTVTDSRATVNGIDKIRTMVSSVGGS